MKVSLVLVFTLFPMFLGVLSANEDSWLETLKENTTAFLQGRKLRIVSNEIDPFLNQNGSRYDGFIPDVLEALSAKLGFDYDVTLLPVAEDGERKVAVWREEVISALELYETSDGASGADLAATSLIVASSDATHMQLLSPLLEGGVAAVIRQPSLTEQEEELTNFSLLTAGSNAVWVISVAVPVSVALLLWLIHRLTSLVAEVENKSMFTLGGALWFALASVEWQGYMTAPKLHGARLLAISFFAFVTLLLAAYISALVNYFDGATQVQINQALQAEVKSLSDITEDSSRQWSYIAERDSYIQDYILSAPSSTFAKIRESWGPNQQDHLVSMSDAIQQLSSSNGSLALLTDEFTAQHIASGDPCNFWYTTDTSGSLSVNFATPQGHPLWEAFNLVLLDLRDTGKLDELQRKWFNSGDACPAVKTVRQVKPKNASPATIVPPLVFIGGGFGLCFLLTMIDLILIRSRGKGLSGDRKQETVSLHTVDNE